MSLFKHITILSSIGILAVLSSFKHPFFVGVTEIKYEHIQKVIQVSSRLFFDDFESALKKDLNIKGLDLLNPKDSALTDQYVKTYFLKHLTLLKNGKPLDLNYLGYEIQKESVWIYLESNITESEGSYTIVNTLLCHIFDKQNNILQWKGFKTDQNKNMSCSESVWLVP
jgi:hypothetical protein